MEGVAISFSRLTPFLREPQLLVEGGQQQGSTPGTWRPGAQAPKNRPQPLHHPEGTQRGTVHFRWGAPSDCRPTSSSAEPGAAMNIRAPVQGSVLCGSLEEAAFLRVQEAEASWGLALEGGPGTGSICFSGLETKGGRKRRPPSLHLISGSEAGCPG